MSGMLGIAKKAYITVRGRTQTTELTVTPTRTMREHTESVSAVAFFKDGRRAVTGSWDCTLRIWDVQKGVLIGGPFEGPRHKVWSVAVSPDDKRIASGGEDDTIIIWDVKSKRVVLKPLVKHTGTVYSVCFSPDGKRLASGSSNFKVIVWNAETGAVLATFKGHRDQVFSVAFSPDGQKLASGSRDCSIRVWRTDNAELLLNIPNAHQDRVRSVVWSPDGQQLISASADKTVRFWSSSNGHQIGQPCTGHTDWIHSLAISSDGSFIATASADNTLRRWSTKTRQQIGRPLEHAAQVFCVAIPPMEALLMSGDYGGTVRLWSMNNTVSVQQLPQRYVSPPEVKGAIRSAIDARLENAPLRLLDTFTGRLCDREAQINTFIESTEYKQILSSSMTHTSLQTEFIEQAVAEYFSWVMLSHRWGRKEPLLRDVQDKAVYKLRAVEGNMKLQMFCKTARDAGYRWAWSDTCCIDQTNNVELQESVNSMFVWYHYSALTIVYLSDAKPSSKSGALANSDWNMRGWTVQEFLAPNIVRFYQADWTLYIYDRTPNHKKSARILQELEDATGINARALVAFRPGMRDAREKLQWASSRITTLQEDIAYSLFGIFGVHLPVIYGEKRQNALGRLLQEIVAHSGDITALDWVGQPSEFNSCLPASIVSYKAPPCAPPSLSEAEMQTFISTLRNNVSVESASQLYALLDDLGAPRFANTRLQLPCIAFPVTEVRQRHEDQETCFTYDVKANGLQDLLITTKDELVVFSPARPTRQTFFLIRPWNRRDIGLPDFADNVQDTRETAPDDLDSQSRALRLIVRLGQPFGALLLAQQRGWEYKRIASDKNIIAQVKDMAAVRDMMDVRTPEIL
ncbi:WD40-repeat-containing domain protein [Suillus ampliporus]|nr:WD40-repeat-containing domain protein [Suillus ampliporus]